MNVVIERACGMNVDEDCITVRTMTPEEKDVEKQN